MVHADADAEHEALLAFLNAAPVGLLQLAVDGTVELVNGRSAQLLLPLTRRRRLDNLFDVLAGVAPDLRQRVQAHPGLHGTVCDALRLPVSAPGSPAGEQVLALTLVRLDRRRLAAVLDDVTAHVQSERALQVHRERLQFTLDAVQLGDWELDLQTGDITRSVRHDHCFGYTELQPAWSLDSFLQHVHEDDRGAVMHSLHAAVSQQQAWRAECRVLWPDGSVHWITTHGHVQVEDGRARRMMGIVIDTTAQREAESVRVKARLLEAENRQIQAASRMKSQFLATMSHELRTPLNAIIGFADLLVRGRVPPESPKHATFLGHIGDSGRHLLQLINDVLDLSKVESGTFEFSPEPLHLPTLLDEVQGVLSAGVQRKGLTLACDVDPSLGPLHLDAARLKQALFNFLSNAIKFTPAGGRLTVRARAPDDAHLRIEVEDTGIGIDEADLPRLFVEFQQLDAGYDRRHEGTGLGLALTRRLVEAQGGSVGVRSVKGQGSVFHLVLNRVHGTDLALPELGATAGARDGVQRLLVIEDREAGRQVLRAGLDGQGWQVDSAATGSAALQQARGTPYDAITLGLQLPDEPGLGVLRQIRDDSASHASPVVGVMMPADSGASAAFAIANLLCKPIRSDEVVRAMGRLRPPDGRALKVMVVDDDPLALDLMRATLTGIGVDCVTVSDGFEALGTVEQHRPDALVLDLMMPVIDGFQVLDALRRMPAGQALPVFIWTSLILTDEEYARLARSARAILGKGGGALQAVLDDLRRWQRPVAVPVGLGPP